MIHSRDNLRAGFQSLFIFYMDLSIRSLIAGCDGYHA